MTVPDGICELLLLRHGESTWNATRRWQGQEDPPLTPRGEDQATTSVEALRALGSFDAVVTSTLRRAARTGELIAAGLGIDDVRRSEALIERHAGPWQGLTRFEIEDGWPGYLDDQRRPQGYEPDPSVVARSSSALVDLAARFLGRSAVVVSHGGVINALEKHRGEPWQRLDNLEGRWFQSDGADLVPIGDRVRLVAWDAPTVDRGYA